MRLKEGARERFCRNQTHERVRENRFCEDVRRRKPKATDPYGLYMTAVDKKGK
jgi:hypothetical protein